MFFTPAGPIFFTVSPAAESKENSLSLKALVNRFFGHGPYRVAPLAALATARGHPRFSPIHWPELQSALVASVPTDSFFAPAGHSLLSQQAQPELLGPLPRYRHAGLLTSRPRELWLLDDGAVAGTTGAVWCPRTRILLSETARHWFRSSYAHSLLCAFRFPPPRPLAGLTLHLGTLDAEGFYHFLIEAVPKLALARPFLRRIDHFLVNGRPGGFQEKWLRLASIDPSRIQWLEGLSHFRCEQLLFVCPLAEEQGPTPWFVSQLRSLFPSPSAPTGRLLWLTRAGAACRHLIWEQQLLDRLPGFERVDPAAMDPAAQVALFASAAVVAGPHGAGFANLVFCAPGTRVIEVMPNLRHLPLYARLSAASGLTHCWFAANFTQPTDTAGIASAIIDWLKRPLP